MLPIVRAWGAFKDWLSATMHLSHAMLHIHVGLIVFLASASLIRRPLGSVAPLLIVLGLEMANEALDVTRYRLSGWPWTPSASLVDIVTTMLWPLALTLYCRRPTAPGSGSSDGARHPCADRSLQDRSS